MIKFPPRRRFWGALVALAVPLGAAWAPELARAQPQSAPSQSAPSPGAPLQNAPSPGAPSQNAPVQNVPPSAGPPILTLPKFTRPKSAPPQVPSAATSPGPISKGAPSPITPAQRAASRGAAAKAPLIAAPVYRAVLQKALDDLAPAAAAKTPRAAAGKAAAIAAIVKSLDANFRVRRADGQVQATSGHFWSRFAGSLSSSRTSSPSQIRAEARRARQALGLQIRALDEWNGAPLYQPVDARKIVAGLVASNQIRVGPLWWQKLYTDVKSALLKAWQNFAKWFSSLFPKMNVNSVAGPSDKLLWFLFYCLVTAVLGAILWFLWRTFGGKLLGRRTAKRAAQLENEDAELLQLPPDELLSRAARFAAEGNFREALRHRYLSLLLDLDARGVWRYDARRTNWEHIAALSRSAGRRELVAPLSELTKRFDRVRYGGAPCDDGSWERFDADARLFENQAAPLQKILAREGEKQSREKREKELSR